MRELLLQTPIYYYMSNTKLYLDLFMCAALTAFKLHARFISKKKKFKWNRENQTHTFTYAYEYLSIV